MKRHINTLAILLVFLAMQPAHAEVGKIVGLSDALETDKINVILDKNKQTGEVIITDCETCPLQLKLLPQTNFYYKGEKLSRNDLWKVGGKPGTVFFDKASKQVKKIKW